MSKMRTCRGLLAYETIAGMVLVYRTSKAGQRRYKYRCQRCGYTGESTAPREKCSRKGER